MKKTLMSIGIVTAIALTGCTPSLSDQMKMAPKSVAQMIPDKQVIGWQDYKVDKDRDGVPDYKDKCLKTPRGVKVDKNGCALDYDSDGVPDYKDKCPNTPIGIPVDKNGCAFDNDGDKVANYKDKCPNTPIGMPVDKSGCALDDDKDSVPNSIDKCPHTPKGVDVDKTGCFVDTDQDGVPNYKDKCPKTPKGIKVNFQGCPILAEFRFNFKFNSYKIDKKYYPQIEKLVKVLKNDKKIKLEIQGFTDNIGSKAYNKELSLNRANALRKILVDKYKISPKRITIKGYGESHPIASNKTEKGRAKNRRIVVVDMTNFNK